MKSDIKSPGKTKQAIFKIISMLLPMVLLIFVEAFLRLFNYGHDLSLFTEYTGDKNYLVMNPAASQKYFTTQKIATTGNREIFKKKKDDNTIRIFVLGESTTLGYPYFHNGSFHRWLQYRLMHTAPDKKFEIINVALTAVNSYTTLGFAKELVDHQPDAVLIYTGHNEYYGALGVGSTENIGGNPFMVHAVLRLRTLRLVQLITNAYQKMASSGTSLPTGTRMQMMVAKEEIPFGSSLYRKGVEQFRSNMEATIKLLDQHNVPVFVSNLVSNERDLIPFVSNVNDTTLAHNFYQQFNRGLSAFHRSDLATAQTYIHNAYQIYPDHAACNYYLGQIAWQRQDFPMAKKYFSSAVDLDGLRFRASQEMNNIIAALCEKYPNAHLVNTKVAFESHSPGSIIGQKLMLEHVHPNLLGYAIMSDVFYRELKNEKIITMTDDDAMSFEHLVRVMPITAVDSLAGTYKIARLKSYWPFDQVLHQDTLTIKTDDERLAMKLATNQVGWQKAMDITYTENIQSGNFHAARRVAETLFLEYPLDASLCQNAAMLSGELGDTENALFYFKKTFDLSPSFEIAKYLFVLYLKEDRPDEAMKYIDYAVSQAPSYRDLKAIKTQTIRVLQWKKELNQQLDNLTIMGDIAKAYYSMSNKEGASIYAKKILTIDPRNELALTLLSNINAIQSNGRR